jgi:uncharacterized protein (DUF305 family)
MHKIPNMIICSFVVAALAGGVRAGLASGPAPTRQQQLHEIHYLELVADHHAMGVMMAEMCEEKAVSPLLHEICAEAAAKQAEELEMVLSWLHDWYGIDYEPDVSGMGQMNRLMGLEGPAFDVEFSEKFIKHHLRIIRASAQELDKLYHPEAIQLATSIVVNQSAQVDELRAVIESYGVTPPPGLDVQHLPE